MSASRVFTRLGHVPPARPACSLRPLQRQERGCVSPGLCRKSNLDCAGRNPQTDKDALTGRGLGIASFAWGQGQASLRVMCICHCSGGSSVHLSRQGLHCGHGV